jgi:hypothetical protein
MINLYLLSKKIHRILVLIISMLTIIMGGTGLLMKYPSIAQRFFVNKGFITYIHNNLSIYFVLALGLMMLTGLYMYFFPVLRKK